MAPAIQLSAEVILTTVRMTWVVAKAEYIGWCDNSYSPPSPVLRVVEPTEYAGLTARTSADHMPAEIRAALPSDTHGRFKRELRRARRPIGPIEVLIGIGSGGKAHNVNGWEMREEFLELDHTSSALATFLNHYGHWNKHQYSEEIHFKGSWETGWRDIVSMRFRDFEQAWYLKAKPRYVPSIVFPEEIWSVKRWSKERDSILPFSEPMSLQEIIKWGLVQPPEKWLSTSFALLSLYGPGVEFPHVHIAAGGCYEVMLATITIDHLRGTKYRICARKDCGMPFPLESRHKRQYCQQYCAHLESVRRNRRLVES